MANSVSNLQSAVWDLARIDEQDYKLAWCKIKTRDECKKPIRRGGKKVKNFSTSVVKRHFEKYHPEELARAEKRKKDAAIANKKPNISTFLQNLQKNDEFQPIASTPSSSSVLQQLIFQIYVMKQNHL